MHINFVVNTHRPDAIEAAQKAKTYCLSHGISVGAEPDVADLIEVPEYKGAEISHASFVVCFGGDGTLMRAAHLCSERGTPILGVYFGRFGFVTQCKGDEVGAAISAMADGSLSCEERLMLKADLLRNGDVVTTIHALNEVVLQRSVTARMMIFGVMIDGIDVTSYPADGVIVCTPTGSTGYNLSAGGPIMDPNLQAIALTALSPHTLSARPLLLRADSVVMLMLHAEGDAVLSADGQSRLHLLSGDEVRITRSERVTRLVTVEAQDFLVKLSERLFWGHSIAKEKQR
ncbi:MAG: NAD(+)/NADH kinase [Fimbriimonadaceae bacterium]|nr:NAD(+)/NADH kinase [Fimbriimonadaceae bacterium]